MKLQESKEKLNFNITFNFFFFILLNLTNIFLQQNIKTITYYNNFYMLFLTIKLT